MAGLPPLAPVGPPDLAADLRPALVRLGFGVQCHHSPIMTLLLAHWPEPGTKRVFSLTYTHYRPEAGPPLGYVSLAVGTECLLTDTHVRKVAEVRLLLLNNRRYKAARLAALAAGTLLPAHSQSISL